MVSSTTRKFVEEMEIMIKAFLIDFYGTVVHEDDVMKKINQEIFETGKANSTSEIGLYWWNEFHASFLSSYGDHFVTQRCLEYQSLVKTIQHFQSTANAEKISQMMFNYWINPPIFEESKQFFEQCSLPIYIVSNIDREDILKAIEFHGLKPAGVFTSEDAKSYKPRKEIFELALEQTKLNPDEVIHIGDSLGSDVAGAHELGIKAIWVNRSNRKIPDGVKAVSNLLEIL